MKPGIKLALILFVLWSIVLLFLNSSLYQSDSNNPSLKKQLLEALKEMEIIRKQNNIMTKKLEELRIRQFQLNEMREVRLDIEKTPIPINVPDGTALINNELLTSSKNIAVELWYFLSKQLKMVIADLKETRTKDAMFHLANLFDDTQTHHRYLLKELELLSESGAKERQFYSEKLGSIVQARISELQNPADCSSSRKLICNLNKGCGFGCQLHHVVYCLLVAHGTNRTMILDSKGWKYSPQKGWGSYFRPLSATCQVDGAGPVKQWAGDNGQEPAVSLTIIESLFPRSEFLPQAVPQDLVPILSKFHEHPFVWWVGQFAKYAMRLDNKLLAQTREMKKDWNFRSPIVGVHVRRTDKVGSEAAYHALSEYMVLVEEYFTLQELKRGPLQRRVYLATDEPAVVDEAKQKYENYVFISEQSFSKGAGMLSRYSDASLRGIILDIHFLSSCDFLVCTFSSQVCRVAYELMQTRMGDATRNFKSLDDIYYYGGQTGHKQVAVLNHDARDPNEIDLKVGDEIGVAGNHWDGRSKGTNHRTGRSGLYPSYKVKEKVVVADFPGYSNVEQFFVKSRQKT